MAWWYQSHKILLKTKQNLIFWFLNTEGFIQFSSQLFSSNKIWNNPFSKKKPMKDKIPTDTCDPRNWELNKAQQKDCHWLVFISSSEWLCNCHFWELWLEYKIRSKIERVFLGKFLCPHTVRILYLQCYIYSLFSTTYGICSCQKSCMCMGASPWAMVPARNLHCNGLSIGCSFLQGTPTCSRLGSSTGYRWMPAPPVAQVFHKLQRNNLCHHGLYYWLKGNLRSRAPSPLLSDLSVCWVVSLTFCHFSLRATVQLFLPFLEYTITKSPPTSLIGSALSIDGSIMESAETGFLQHRGSFWCLLTESPTAGPPWPKPCHIHLIQSQINSFSYSPFLPSQFPYPSYISSSFSAALTTAHCPNVLCLLCPILQSPPVLWNWPPDKSKGWTGH